jgi:O-antigen/teichoic acid export membrane protein
MGTTMTTGIGAKTVRAMFWAYGSYVGSRLISVISIAILARVLVPRDFGLVALALTFIAFVDLVQGLGISEALVIGGARGLEERAETAFVINVGSGFLLAALTAAVAPIAAAFFNQPRLIAIMPALGANFILIGLGTTHAGLALKAMDFRSRTIAELALAVVRGLISVVLALLGFGVWSLVVGYVAGTVAWDAALWRLVSWRPSFHPQKQHVRELLRFGGSLTGVALMGAFMAQFDNIVIGRVLGASQLGFYSIATRLPMLLILNLAVVAGRVLFPAFASLRERGEMRRGVLTSLRYTAIVTLPLGLFLVILAKPLTLALFGDRWRPAIGAMQVLSLWAVMTTMGMIWGNLFKAYARPDIILKLAIPQALALVVGSLVFVHRGIVAVSWVQAVIAMVAQVSVVIIAQRLFGLTVGSVLNAIRPAILASAGLAAVLLVLRHVLAAPWAAVATGGIVGAAVYLGLLLLLAPDVVKRLRTIAFTPPKTPHLVPETLPVSASTSPGSAPASGLPD